MIGTPLFGRDRLVCIFCQRDTRKEWTVHAADHPDIVICSWCYTKWSAAGAECGECHTPVIGADKVGVFPERHTFGHTDCGAIHVRH
jgi:hypothetical protein